MTYSDEDVRLHLKLGEDNYWEFKGVEFQGNQPASPKRDVWADEISAFANTRGGVILCGVTDDSQIPGMSKEQMDVMESWLKEVCNDKIKPAVSVNIHRMEPEEDKTILLVEVPQGYTVHKGATGYWHRCGSSKREMSPDEHLRLLQQRGQTRFQGYDEQPVQGAGFGTLSEVLWEPLLTAEGKTDPKTALEKLALLVPDESGTMCATVAGVLLCSERPEDWWPNARITATRYHGEDRAFSQANTQEITGPLGQQVSAAVKFVIGNMSVTARKTPDRADLPQYSERAVFEALVNAVAHRDYSIHGSQIRLSMFEDRLEIQSPGGLLDSMTIEELGSRVVTRNGALVRALKLMPMRDRDIPGSGEHQFLMEQRGDGVPIIRRETEQLCGRGPVYKLIDDTDLCLTLFAAPQQQGPVQFA